MVMPLRNVPSVFVAKPSLQSNAPAPLVAPMFQLDSWHDCEFAASSALA
jgi:hypothetical protein